MAFASFRRRYKKLCQNKSFNSLSSSSSALFRIQQISTDGFKDGLELLPENPIGAEYAVPPVSVEAGTEPGESAEKQSDSCQSPAQFLGQKIQIGLILNRLNPAPSTFVSCKINKVFVRSVPRKLAVVSERERLCSNSNTLFSRIYSIQSKTTS